METYFFKQKYEERLNKLNIKTKFIKNVEKDTVFYKPDQDLEYRLNKLNRHPIWESFIKWAFYFPYTDEGVEYWENISQLEEKEV